MEQLNKEELQVLELIENKSFNELSKEEMNLCLKYYELEELELLFEIKHNEQNINENLKPAPLVIPEVKNSNSLKYFQLIGSIAATVVICWFLFKNSNKEVQYVTQIKTKRDTIVQNQIIRDTILQIVEKPVYVKVYESNKKDLSEKVDIPASPTNNASNFDLSSFDISTKGIPLSQDPSMSILVQKQSE